MYTRFAKYQIGAVVFVEIASRRARRLTNFLWVCYNFPVLRHEAGALGPKPRFPCTHHFEPDTMKGSAVGKQCRQQAPFFVPLQGGTLS